MAREIDRVGVEDAPEEEYTSLRVLTLPRTGSWRGVLLGRKPLIVRTHWVGNRTVAHVHPNCPHCECGWPIKLDGYQLAIPLKGPVAVLPLTVSALVDLVGLDAQFEGLRGLVVEVMRTANRSNGRVSVVGERKVDQAKLPPDRCLKKLVAGLLGVPPFWPLCIVTDILAPEKGGNQ